MAKDYKSYSSKNKKKNKRWFMWFVVIILAIAFIYGLYWLSQKDKVVHKTKLKQTNIQPKKKTSKPLLPKIKFEFYNLLPKETVTVPNVKKSSDEISATKQIQQKYKLQVASVKNFKDADALKAKLTLDGFNVDVKKMQINESTWYRVQIGPFNSFNDAFDAQNQLRKDDYDGIIKKIK